MKKKLLKPLAMLLLALLGHYAPAAAQPKADHPARREARAYYQANVLPVLRQQRQKLEPQLSAADQAQLASYRTQLRDLKQQGHALRQRLRPAATPAGTRPALTEEQRQQVQQLRAAARGIMLNVTQLAQKYEAPIAQLTAEIQPQRTKWEADLRAIGAQNAPAEQPRGGRAHRGGLAGLTKPARFLLLAPNATAAAPAATSPTAFPNPAAATSQLEYTVKKAGPVTVEILDGRGTVLKTLVQSEAQDKGPHTLAADVADLPSGPYFYKITTRSGVETKRFVKQ